MDPNVKQFLLINAVILVTVVFFILRRRRDRPSRLRMTGAQGRMPKKRMSGSSDDVIDVTATVVSDQKTEIPDWAKKIHQLRGEENYKSKINVKVVDLEDELTPTVPSARPDPFSTRPERPASDAFEQEPEERSINTIFTHNGHTWDAYEVLGIPAGSGQEVVIEAYKSALLRVDSKSAGFIEKAYQAICNSRGW